MKLLFEQEPKNDTMDNQMKTIINQIKYQSGLNYVHGGYRQVYDNTNFMLLVGFDQDIINNSLSSTNTLWLCYIAVAIDPDSSMDDLLENPNLSDWDFEERYVKPIVGTQTIPVGAITIGGTKYRTIKFLGETRPQDR